MTKTRIDPGYDLVRTLAELGLSPGDSPPDSLTLDVDGLPLTFINCGCVVDSQDRILYWSYWPEENGSAADPLINLQVWSLT